jgi:hypothetical protein
MPLNAVQLKVDKYAKPWQQLKIAYGSAKGRSFNEAEDRFMACITHTSAYVSIRQHTSAYSIRQHTSCRL